MSGKTGIMKSTIGMKFTMALSALFLIVFLVQHFTINFTSVVSPETFNELSHFMGTNPLVQFALQPILMLGVTYHFVMGFILTAKNNKARQVKYFKNNGAANSSWMSRNMVWSGLFILFFLGFHFYDFWLPEMNHKYIEQLPADANRYYGEVVHMFENPLRIAVYCLSFVFLALHLMHGFESSFQSIGARHPKYTPAIKKIGTAYAILIPAGFIFIALFHYFNSL